MKNNRGKKSISPIKSTGIWLILIGISLISFFLTFFIMSRIRPAPEIQEDASLSCMAVIVLFLSGVSLAAGAASYGLVLLTNCFTFSFEKTVWHSATKARLYVANIIVSTLVLIGISGLGAGLLGAVISSASGIPFNSALLIPFLIIFVPGQLFFTWFNLWKPLLCSLITRRMAHRGISQEEMETGMFAGVSDPAVSSMRKFSMIEDDLGMLWLTPEMIRYRGDRQDYDIRQSQIIEIERAADRGSIAAYAGAVHVIIHYRSEDENSQKVRVHLENFWTLSRLAHMLDDLGDRLEAWKNAETQSPGE